MDFFDDGWIVFVLILILLMVGGPIAAFIALARTSTLMREIEVLRKDLRGLAQVAPR